MEDFRGMVIAWIIIVILLFMGLYVSGHTSDPKCDKVNDLGSTLCE